MILFFKKKNTQGQQEWCFTSPLIGMLLVVIVAGGESCEFCLGPQEAGNTNIQFMGGLCYQNLLVLAHYLQCPLVQLWFTLAPTKKDVCECVCG